MNRLVFRITDEFMGKRIIQGREVSAAQVQAWADEAEAGYDVEELQKRWGRPPRAERASQVVPTRFSDAELAELMARADREGLDRSAAIRDAVHAWAHVWLSPLRHESTESATRTQSRPRDRYSRVALG